MTCPRCGKRNENDARFCSACARPLNSDDRPGALARKTVTLVFSDVSGSTAMGESLDPESVREIMNRYFELARIAIERHGGTVEKYVGDAVMAAFGIPTAHEDDALRAVRAAAELRDSLHELNDELVDRLGSGLAVRIGVNTGEVIAGDPSAGQAFASGDAVNVAARLEQAAPPGEVLLGERTYGLVRDAVSAEAVEPLEAKGKAEPLTAYRLLALGEAQSRGIARNLDAPLVGREAELGALEGALSRAIEQNRSQAVVVVAEAGMGKSRLARAFTERASQTATVLSARCPSYGEGALWPMQEALLRLADIDAGDPPEVGRKKLAALAPDADRLVLETLTSFLGLGAGSPDIGESRWAILRLCDELASKAPVLVVVDDAHWADEALLELTAELAADHQRPLLAVVLSRPELLEGEARPELSSTETIHLRPLVADDQERIALEILGAEAPAELLERLRERAAGNPLYLGGASTRTPRQRRPDRQGRRAGDHGEDLGDPAARHRRGVAELARRVAAGGGANDARGGVDSRGFGLAERGGCTAAGAEGG